VPVLIVLVSAIVLAAMLYIRRRRRLTAG